jgi:hypothetical protein
MRWQRPNGMDAKRDGSARARVPGRYNRAPVEYTTGAAGALTRKDQLNMRGLGCCGKRKSDRSCCDKCRGANPDRPALPQAA